MLIVVQVVCDEIKNTGRHFVDFIENEQRSRTATDGFDNFILQNGLQDKQDLVIEEAESNVTIISSRT